MTKVLKFLNSPHYHKALLVMATLTVLLNLFTFVKENSYILTETTFKDAIAVSWSSILCMAMAFATVNMPVGSLRRHVVRWAFEPNLILMFCFSLFITIGYLNSELNESGLIFIVPLIYPFLIIPASTVFGGFIWFIIKYLRR